MTPRLSLRRQRRLVRQLQAARESLAAWDGSLRGAASAAPFPSANAELIALLHATGRALDQRLLELGEAAPSAGGATAFPSASRRSRHAPPPAASKVSPARMAWRACRACGRALGAAFREAQAAADAASARLIYAPLRAFEKQLWVLDPGQPH